jgi:hypothetical protein
MILFILLLLTCATRSQLIGYSEQSDINLLPAQFDTSNPCYYSTNTELTTRAVLVNTWDYTKTAMENIQLTKESCLSQQLCFDWKALHWCWKPLDCTTEHCKRQVPPLSPPAVPSPSSPSQQQGQSPQDKSTTKQSTTTSKSTTTPFASWKCIQSCADNKSFVRVADTGYGIQCNGFNSTLCTWFSDPACSIAMPNALPPSSSTSGHICNELDFLGGWCLEARNQIIDGKTQTDCNPPPPPPPPAQNHPGLQWIPGQPVFGIHNDWGAETPLMWVNGHDGVVPGMFTGFLSLGSSFQESNMRTHVELVAMAAKNGVSPGYMIATMPWEGLHAISDGAIQQLVGACRDAENRGVHIVVRFGHEVTFLNFDSFF